MTQNKIKSEASALEWIRHILEEKYGEDVTFSKGLDCPHCFEHRLKHFAVDVKVRRVSPDLVMEFLDHELEGCGLHHLGDSVHLDLRPSKFRKW